MSRIRLFLAASAFSGFILIPAHGATDEELAQLKAQIEAEVGAIKKDYESRIKGLEQRIDTLEADNAKLRGQQAMSRIDENSLTNAGIDALLRLPNNTIHLLVGLNADQYAAEMRGQLALPLAA